MYLHNISLIYSKMLRIIQDDNIRIIKKNSFGTTTAVACGVFSSVEEAAEKIVRVTETIEPEPELVEKYERQYQKFAKIYPTVKDLFTELLQ